MRTEKENLKKQPSTPKKYIKKTHSIRSNPYDENWETERKLQSNKIILKKYNKHLLNLIESNHLSLTTAKREWGIILSIAENIPNLNQATPKQIGKWWFIETNRRKRYYTHDTIIKTKQKTSHATQKKTKIVMTKLLKFIYFEKHKLTKNQVFYPKTIPLDPSYAMALTLLPAPKKQTYQEIPTQKQIQSLIRQLRTTGKYQDKQLSVLIALANDTGMRYSEMTTLLNKDIQPENDYLTITLRESKTQTRKVISFLAKPYILDWFKTHPTKENPDALFFCNKNKKPISHTKYATLFKKLIKETKIVWRPYGSFHFLRHVFCSRAGGWPPHVLSYWVGWRLSGMANTYVHNLYEQGKKEYFNMLEFENNPMYSVYENKTRIELEAEAKESALFERYRKLIEKDLRENPNKETND